jgi:hypothetical protein
VSQDKSDKLDKFDELDKLDHLAWSPLDASANPKVLRI